MTLELNHYLAHGWLSTWSAVLAVIATTAGLAHAQDRQFDIAAGYMNIGRFMHGSNVQLGFGLGDHWTLVGEVDVTRGADCRDCTPRYRDLGVLGGVRYGWHPNNRLSPFWQILAGALHSRAESHSYEITRLNGSVEQRVQDGYVIDYLAVQPGAGLDIMVAPRVGLRIQTDFQLAIPDQARWDGFSIFPRVAAGAVIRLGRGR